ncbi:hypothetical protein MRB53_040031 [Persea americana]|nr:hypothetical protein MRB53_040031 [Persea americana]
MLASGSTDNLQTQVEQLTLGQHPQQEKLQHLATLLKAEVVDEEAPLLDMSEQSDDNDAQLMTVDDPVAELQASLNVLPTLEIESFLDPLIDRDNARKMSAYTSTFVKYCANTSALDDFISIPTFHREDLSCPQLLSFLAFLWNDLTQQPSIRAKALQYALKFLQNDQSLKKQDVQALIPPCISALADTTTIHQKGCGSNCHLHAGETEE